MGKRVNEIRRKRNNGRMEVRENGKFLDQRKRLSDKMSGFLLYQVKVSVTIIE